MPRVTNPSLRPARSRPVPGVSNRKPPVSEQEKRGQWGRFSLITVLTVVVLVPVVAVVLLALTPSAASGKSGLTLDNIIYVLTDTLTPTWLLNSLVVALATVVVSVIVAAPAGYVLSRGRSRMVSGYALLLFVIQSLPVITAVIPLFILFANFGLVDTLTGLTIVYVGASMSVATWMMAAYMDSIPVSLEEAAWIDGASVFGSFMRIVLRNSLPGNPVHCDLHFPAVLERLPGRVVFLRTETSYTMPVGLQSFFQQNVTDWGSVMAVAVIMLLPPVLVFAVLNRYFSVGGIGGSLAGR